MAVLLEISALLLVLDNNNLSRSADLSDRTLN